MRARTDNPFRNPLMPISLIMGATVSTMVTFCMLLEGCNPHLSLFCPSMLITGLIMKVHSE